MIQNNAVLSSKTNLLFSAIFATKPFQTIPKRVQRYFCQKHSIFLPKTKPYNCKSMAINE
jgi:hypothetical protein